MASLETMGYFSDAPGSQRYPPLFRHFHPDRGDFLGLVSDVRSRRAMRRLAAAFRTASDFPLEHTATFRWIPGVAWSDHRSFWRAGYPAVMITDTAFYRYRYYHTAADKPDKLTYDAFPGRPRGCTARSRPWRQRPDGSREAEPKSSSRSDPIPRLQAWRRHSPSLVPPRRSGVRKSADACPSGAAG